MPIKLWCSDNPFPGLTPRNEKTGRVCGRTSEKKLEGQVLPHLLFGEGGPLGWGDQGQQEYQGPVCEELGGNQRSKRLLLKLKQ